MMHQKIIENFLDLPGVVKIALISGKKTLYFYDKEATPELQGKQIITQSIMKALTEHSEEMHMGEFKVMGYYAYIYKLTYKLQFIVLADNNNPVIKIIGKQVKVALQENIDNTLTSFGVLRSDIFQTYAEAEDPPLAPPAEDPPLAPPYEGGELRRTEVKVTIAELLAVLNHLSKVSSNYMGAKLVAKNWQITRPNVEWLEKIQINPSAQITFSGGNAEIVSATQHQWVKEWAAAFIKQCSTIVQDLPALIEQGLDETKKSLILTTNIV